MRCAACRSWMAENIGASPRARDPSRLALTPRFDLRILPMAAPPLPVQSLRALVGKDHSTLVEVWDARVNATPEAVALIWEGRRWSYAQAMAEIDAFAGFAATGLRPGGRVASYLPNRPEALWCWLGAAMAGAVFVPLNRKHKGALLADMLARSGATILVS
ncbi:MAG: ATP-dependent acyl-CoA ligase, partial [Alphaproteobacteria bacterium]|nr:ATP-dependent acyl-CoA ligase [Alphaproteobacteria bacterium]